MIRRANTDEELIITSIRIPRKIKEIIDQKASKKKWSFNQLINEILNIALEINHDQKKDKK